MYAPKLQTRSVLGRTRIKLIALCLLLTLTLAVMPAQAGIHDLENLCLALIVFGAQIKLSPQNTVSLFRYHGNSGFPLSLGMTPCWSGGVAWAKQ